MGDSSKSGKGSHSESGKSESHWSGSHSSKSGKDSHSESGRRLEGHWSGSHSSKSGKGSHSKSGKSGSSKSGKAHSKSGKSEDYYYSSSKSGKGGSKSSKSMDYHPDCDFTCYAAPSFDEGEIYPLCAHFFSDPGAYCDGTSDCGTPLCECVAGEYFCMEGKNPCTEGWSDNKP